MRYEEPVYRPPSEANSLLIQATLGCPHNQCTFCGMYKGKKFRIRPVSEIKEDICLAKESYGDSVPEADPSFGGHVETMFFPDGNTIIMKTDQLEEIFKFAYQTFPNLKRITLYGSAKIIKFKTLEELIRLRKAGLKRIHMGLESGNDRILKKIQKGADAQTMTEIGQRVKKAGMELSEYVLIGIGGEKLWREHAVDTADVLNAINPDFIRLRTWVPVPVAPLYKDYEAGDFKLLSPHAALREIKLLLEKLEVSSLFLSDHISNFVNISGHLPRDKKSMLKKIDEGLQLDESSFRTEIIERL
ncbi:MAG: radical SAM protein [Planctomycetes bacterium]|nr:radical SAM protein [Planctomycetota bacterium]